MEKDKSTNLHDFQHQLFLGFASQQPLKKVEYQVSFIGGQPLWLYEPNQQYLTCQLCQSQNQGLTFLGQIFCPLNAKHCYNRIMYLFYCEKCKRCFRCIKQQTDQNWQPKEVILKKKIKGISSQSFQIESDPIQRKQILKIINRSKIQVQQEIIMEQDQDDSDEQGEEIISSQKMTGEQLMKKLSQIQKAKKNKQYDQKQIEEINRKFQQLKLDQKDQKGQGFKQIGQNKKDFLFQQYRKVMKAINNPVLIYSNIAIPYNKTPLNPKHTCKHCQKKLQLQMQLTQKILLLNKALAMLDWGSIFIYCCTGSCQESQEQCVVLQYQFDAISEEQLAKLKKKNKNRKKNKNKSLSKQKKKLQKKQIIQPQIISKIQKLNDLQEKQEEGDWD